MHPIKFALTVVLVVGCSLLSKAQQNAEGASVQKPPLGHVRVWHFAPSIKTQVSISLTGGGMPKPTILARALTLSDIMNYRDVPVGRYRVTVRAAAQDFSVTEASPEILQPVDIIVGDKTFQTLLLQDAGRTPKIFLVNDTITGANIPRGGKRLRIFNFAAGPVASLRTLPDNQIISEHVGLGSSEHIFPNNPGAMTVVMSNKLPNGHEAQQPMQLDFNRVDSISAVLMFDRYGRLTFQAIEDAKAD